MTISPRLTNSNLVSTKIPKVSLIQGQSKVTLNPKYASSSANLFKPRDKTSTRIMNKVGDSGSPCQRPLVDLKGPKLAPWTITENQTLEINLQIMSMKYYMHYNDRRCKWKS